MESPVEKALALFHEVYQTSKAYKHFVDSHGVRANDIKKVSDFKKIPITDRHNYINKYPLEDRLFGGKKLYDYYMISASSGSTGKPTFWPRDFTTDSHLEKKKEEMYEEHFEISKKNTLCVISFALGNWTGGMLTAKLSWGVANKHNFTVVTPGMNNADTLAYIARLYKFYDQVILLAYPPFLTDFIEFTKEQKFSLTRVNLKVMCTGDRFSETWRDFVVKSISSHKNRYDVVSFYACSDSGIIGCETKLCIDLLNQAKKNKLFCQTLFRANNTPTLVTYDPNIKYLESVDGEIFITARQPSPLIRYNIHDRGNLLHKQKIKQACHDFGITSKNKLDENYVFVFGRSDAVLLAANIYIEDIKYCIENSQFSDKFTGKFKYGREETKDLRYSLKLIVYLKQNEQMTGEEKISFLKEIIKNLKEVNNDFKLIFEKTKMKKFNIEFKKDNFENIKGTKLTYFL
ncbi:hypothetical protein HY357_04515 [Candidatus Roizmanbacteria bacterium]|nr:hypothetical protein [Candidatus Roizmanbacteria bacterium]